MLLDGVGVLASKNLRAGVFVVTPVIVLFRGFLGVVGLTWGVILVGAKSGYQPLYWRQRKLKYWCYYLHGSRDSVSFCMQDFKSESEGRMCC